MAIEGVKVEPHYQSFLDAHFGVTPRWEDFHQKLKDPSFVAAVGADTRSNDKLKAFASAVGMRQQAKGPSVKALSDVSGSYRIKYHPQEDRFSCTCQDWTYKRSVGGDDCKHIQRVKSKAKEMLMNKTKEAVSPADVMFRVGRVVNREQKDKATASNLATENAAFQAAYPRPSFVNQYLKHASDMTYLAKKMASAARNLLFR